MSESGQSRQFGDVRVTSAFPPLATAERTSLEVGRSIDAEQTALRRLTWILGIAETGALVLAVAGGWFLADRAIVTTDNSRSEDPAAIAGEITGEFEMEVELDRRAAIARAVEAARPGDVVVIAGKGHEQGQQFADRTLPFDDRVAAREALEQLESRA